MPAVIEAAKLNGTAPMTRCSPLGEANHRGCAPVQVSWQGYLANGACLAATLELSTDSEPPALLTAAWARWGSFATQRLDGVFSFALRDGDVTWLYRDPSGLRDMFFTPGTDAGRFASRLDGLPAAPGAWPLDRLALHEFLRYLEVAPPHTWRQGTQSLPAGQLLRWTQGQPPEVTAQPVTAAVSALSDLDAAADDIDQRLQRSVGQHLAGSCTPAAFLSGGIDSALLCAAAARQGVRPTAVTVGFIGAEFDETPVAQRIAAHLGLPHLVLRFDRAQFLSAFDRISRCAGQPMADPAAMATVLAFEYCAQHFDRVLDGTGADEAVGMMPPRHVRVAVAHTSRLPPRWRQSVARWLRQGGKRLSGYAPIFDFDHPSDTMSRWHGFTRPEIERLCREPVSLAHTQFHRAFERHPRHAHFARYSDLLNAMTCDRLNLALALSSAPVRFPFWDRAMQDGLQQLPQAHRYQPGAPKRILRAVLARHLPSALWDQPKHGFNFPLHAFLAGDDYALVRRHLDPARWQRHALLDVNEVQQYAQRLLAGDVKVTFRVWALVVLDAWLAHRQDRLDAAT